LVIVKHEVVQIEHNIIQLHGSVPLRI
jgi:hypothetical protein